MSRRTESARRIKAVLCGAAIVFMSFALEFSILAVVSIIGARVPPLWFALLSFVFAMVLPTSFGVYLAYRLSHRSVSATLLVVAITVGTLGWSLWSLLTSYRYV